MNPIQSGSGPLDRESGFDPIGLYFRHVVRERLRILFSPGAHVLDLGCGAGDEALFLGGLGVLVHVVDPAPAAIERLRRRTAENPFAEARMNSEARAARDIPGGEASPFDGAYSTSPALSGGDLSAVGSALATALRRGAPVLLSFMGNSPLPAQLVRAVRGRAREGPDGGRLAGRRPAEVKGLLGDSFEWRGCFGLGILVPGLGSGDWACRHPEGFGILAGVEQVVRRWPGLRALGDRFVIEGIRR